MSNLRNSKHGSVSEAIFERHSIHSFDSTRPVPRELLNKVFSAAQNSASNSNVQPWEVKVITEEKLKRVQNKMVKWFKEGKAMDLPPVPAKFQGRVEKMGAVLYGEGFRIGREEKDRRFEAIAFNFRNYGAPCLALFCIDKSLALADIASVGIYLENVILLCWENGLGTIPQASMAGYAEAFREEIGLEDDLQIICGLGIGYPDEEASVIATRMPKNPWEDHVKFFE